MKNWYKLGQNITISSGEYEDYATCGSYTVTCEFEYNAMVKHWASCQELELEHSEFSGPYYCDRRKENFISHLLDHGFIKPLEMEWMHLGDHGEVEIDDDEI